MAEKKSADTAGKSKKTKTRQPEEMARLVSRLHKIEGQVNGIKAMVENGTYCTDILVQVAATQGALNSFARELLSSHIKTCVASDIRRGSEAAVDELLQTLQKLMK